MKKYGFFDLNRDYAEEEPLDSLAPISDKVNQLRIEVWRSLPKRNRTYDHHLIQWLIWMSVLKLGSHANQGINWLRLQLAGFVDFTDIYSIQSVVVDVALPIAVWLGFFFIGMVTLYHFLAVVALIFNQPHLHLIAYLTKTPPELRNTFKRLFPDNESFSESSSPINLYWAAQDEQFNQFLRNLRLKLTGRKL